MSNSFFIRDHKTGTLAHVKGDPNMSVKQLGALHELLRLAIEQHERDDPAPASGEDS